MRGDSISSHFLYHKRFLSQRKLSEALAEKSYYTDNIIRIK